VGDDILNFEEHRRRQDQNASLVRCARCGKMILATALRCAECGIHFQGEAQDYLHASEQPTRGHRPGWVVAIAIVLFVTVVISVLAFR
jgi:hypothetical protein